MVFSNTQEIPELKDISQGTQVGNIVYMYLLSLLQSLIHPHTLFHYANTVCIEASHIVEYAIGKKKNHANLICYCQLIGLLGFGIRACQLARCCSSTKKNIPEYAWEMGGDSSTQIVQSYGYAMNKLTIMT
jgi:hypothetical protein